jgi:biopolymer transport protein ExbB/TolQ
VPAAGANPQQLAHGISVALYNTAFGLIIAIPALMLYRYFRGRGGRVPADHGTGCRAHGAAPDALCRVRNPS